MQANNRSLQGLLGGVDQYVIPLFQRRYVWEKKNWQRLWEGLVALLEPSAPKQHFLGALVCIPIDHQPGKSPQYLVIDGQQRLITLYMLLCALRDKARKRYLDDIANTIEHYYLVHRHGKGLDHFKVLPRLRDRQTLFDIANRNTTSPVTDGIGHAYTFFGTQIAKHLPKATISSDKLKHLYNTTIPKLSVVIITLEGENAFQIFETLNSTGQPLDEADLIRNHVFMRVPLTEQDQFDDKYWRPLEEQISSTARPPIRLRDFYRDFLMQRGAYVRPDHVFQAFKDYLADHAVRLDSLVEVLRRQATRYLWLHRPQHVADQKLRAELDCLYRLGITTAFPLVLLLLDLNESGALSSVALHGCLRDIQSFVIRRSISRQSTRGYGVLFPSIIRDLDTQDIPASLKLALLARGWPSDATFISALQTFPLYRREPATARVVFKRLEEAQAHREPVDVGDLLDKNSLQLEHILPQSIGNDDSGMAWQFALGNDWQTVHTTWVHTLGNLALTGYNPSLSNHAFEVKRQAFAESHLVLTHELAAIAEWNADEIEQRGAALAKRVAAFWPAPAASINSDMKMHGGDSRMSKVPNPIITWSREDFKRLKHEIRNPTVRAMLSLTSERPEQWVSLREVENSVGRSGA
jgi:hypothetical protein